jgi:hypothetical protein
MEHAPSIQHSLAIQTMSEFYVFYSFTVERGATTLPIMIVLPLDRQRLARVDSGHEFKISLAAFGVKPYPGKPRIAIRRGRDSSAEKRISARRERVFVAPRQVKSARAILSKTRAGADKMAVFPMFAPGFARRHGSRNPKILSACPSITHDKIRAGGRRGFPRVCREFCRDRLSPTPIRRSPTTKIEGRRNARHPAALSLIFVAAVHRPHWAVHRPQ